MGRGWSGTRMHRLHTYRLIGCAPGPQLSALPQLIQQFWFFSKQKFYFYYLELFFFNCANNAKSFSSGFTATLKGQARWRCPNSVEQSVLQAKSEEKFCNHKSGGLEKLCSAFCTCCAHKLPTPKREEEEEGELSQANQ